MSGRKEELARDETSHWVIPEIQLTTWELCLGRKQPGHVRLSEQSCVHGRVGAPRTGLPEAAPLRPGSMGVARRAAEVTVHLSACPQTVD